MRMDLLVCTAALVMVTGCSAEDTNEDTAAAGDEQATTVETPVEAAPSIDGPNLAGVLDFANPATCQWGEAAERIFEADTVFGEDYVSRPGTVSIPGIDNAVTARLSRPEPEYPEYVQVELDFTGEWNGLQVTGMTDAFYEESGGVFARGVRFAEPVEEVTSALSAAGFNLNADGSERSTPLTGADFSQGDLAITIVEALDSGSVFRCNQVFEGL